MNPGDLNFLHGDTSNIANFSLFVYKYMGASSTGDPSTGYTPTTLYILMHNFIISKRVGFNLLILKRANNYL